MIFLAPFRSYNHDHLQVTPPPPEASPGSSPEASIVTKAGIHPTHPGHPQHPAHSNPPRFLSDVPQEETWRNCRIEIFQTRVNRVLLKSGETKRYEIGSQCSYCSIWWSSEFIGRCPSVPVLTPMASYLTSPGPGTNNRTPQAGHIQPCTRSAISFLIPKSQLTPTLSQL